MIQPENEAEVRALLEELYRRKGLEQPGYIRDLHPAQAAFLADPSRFKTARCGRRAGKTEMAIRGLFHQCELHPESTVAYMAITRENARRLFWMPAQRMARRYSVECQFNKVEATIYFPNGSQLWLLGADDEADIEKVRGPAYRVFVLDEAASYKPFIAALVRDGVEPALGDVRGQLWQIGSPGRLTAGYFYECDQHPGGVRRKWSNHHWNVRDNTYFLDPEGWLAETLEENGWTADSPTYRREYLGEWVVDESYQVYRFDPERNGIGALPPQPDPYEFVLGIDVGVAASTSFVVWAFNAHDPLAYCIRAYKKPGLSVSDVAEEIRLLRDRYAPLARRDNPFLDIVLDTGGMGAAHAKEFEQRHGIFVEAAKKTEKWAFIDHMSSDLLSGRIRVVRGADTQPLIDEWQTIEWDSMIGIDGKEAPKKDSYNDKFEDHCADAALYAWRRLLHYRAVPRDETRPRPGRPGWLEEIERRAIEAECLEARVQAGEVDEAELEDIRTSLAW